MRKEKPNNKTPVDKVKTPPIFSTFFNTKDCFANVTCKPRLVDSAPELVLLRRILKYYLYDPDIQHVMISRFQNYMLHHVQHENKDSIFDL